MVYSLPVLIFCFINIFNSTWADACNSLSSTHQGNDENFNNRNIFRSILFEHALRREPRMVNVCERVGTERLVNNRRIVDSDSRITNFPARDGTNGRIQNSRIAMEKRNSIVFREVRTENNNVPREAGREILINRQSRSSDPTTFQRRNIRERIDRDSRYNRVTRNEVRSRNLDASRQRDLDIRLDQTDRNSRVDPKDSFARSRSVRSLPDVSRFNDLEDSIRVVRDSGSNARSSSRQDRTVRISRSRVQDEEASIRNSRDLSRQERTVRVSRDRVDRNANDVRSRSIEDVRMARDSRTNERMSVRTVRISRSGVQDEKALSRQDRTVRISRDRVDRNANDVRSRSVEDLRMARDSRTSRNFIREVRVVRISREQVDRNANDVRSRSVEDRIVRNSRANEKISRTLSRQDRTVRISRDRVGRNAHDVRSRSVEDLRMARDSRINERVSRNLIRQVRISRERVGRNANDVRSRSVENREASIRDSPIRQNRSDRTGQNENRRIRNIQRVRDDQALIRNYDRISRDVIRLDRTSNDLQSKSVENAQLRETVRVRDDRVSIRIRAARNNERISRDLIRQDRTVRVSRDRNAEMVRDSRNNERISRDLIRQDRMVRVSRDRSRSLEDVERIRIDPEVSIRMARNSRNNARVVRNVIRQERTVRVSRERVGRNAIRDARASNNVRSRNLEDSIRTVRKSQENERLTRTDRDARILQRNVRSVRNQETSDRRVREDGFRHSQTRMERNARLSRETPRSIQSLERDSIRSARNIRDFVVITKNSREQKIRELTSRIDVQKQQVVRRLIDSSPQGEKLETRRPELEMRSINARFLIKDENNNDVDDNSNRLLFLNGKLSSWSNALSTILGILFVAHVLSTSSNTKKSPVKNFSSFFTYQKEKVL